MSLSNRMKILVRRSNREGADPRWGRSLGLWLLLSLSGSAWGDDVTDLNELLRDLPKVGAELRGGAVAVVGFTSSDRERKLLDRVLAKYKKVIDLTTMDVGSPRRMIEIDVVIVQVSDRATHSYGFDFLSLIQLKYDFFAVDNKRPLTGFLAPGTIGPVTDLTQAGHLFSASVDYDVNIANAADEQATVLARPHLAALNGEKAEFQAGGEIVFQVSGIDNGDIKPYPFGVQLAITPTLLLSRDERGRELVLLDVEAVRTSILSLLFVANQSGDDVVFDKTRVASKAVLPMEETLILSGLYQREHRARLQGVPYLRQVPGLNLLFSNDAGADDVQSAVIFVTPRNPSWIDERRNAEIDEFISRRRDYVRARAEGGAAVDAFKGSYPDWFRLRPNRLATQLFMMGNSNIYRQVSGDDLRQDSIESGLWIAESALGAR